jgi:hypothetical protein
MELWVANATKQNIEFNFRVQESPRPYKVEIPVGSQRRVHKPDLTSAECDYIIDQLEHAFGAVPAASVDRTREFIGVCYSIDKSVKAATIEKAVEHNTDVLEARGYELRKGAAVAIHDRLSGAVDNPRDLAETTVEVREQVRPGEKPKVDQTFQVNREGDGPTKPKATRRRKAA